MFPPNFTLKDIPVGQGSIIGRDNLEEFFTHVSMHEDLEDIPLAKIVPTYEDASVCLVRMMEARFISLNPMIQHMFLTLSDMERGEKRDFVLKVLVREFEDIAKEARKVFSKHERLGMFTDFKRTLEKMDMDRIRYTNNVNDSGEIKVPIPIKLLGMHEALEKNFDWIVPKNLFDESSKLMTHKYRGCIVVSSISKNVDPNEEQKVLTSSFDEGFTVNAHRQVFRGF